MKRLSFPRDIFWGRAEGSKVVRMSALKVSRKRQGTEASARNNVKTTRKVTGAYYF